MCGTIVRIMHCIYFIILAKKMYKRFTNPLSYVSTFVVYQPHTHAHTTNNISVNEIVCIDAKLGIYVTESGLTPLDCQNIINISEACAQSRNDGQWSSYTYAKQTLGCRENDNLAFVCAKGVMKACATIKEHLMFDNEDEEEEEEEERKQKEKDDELPSIINNKDDNNNGNENRTSDNDDNVVVDEANKNDDPQQSPQDTHNIVTATTKKTGRKKKSQQQQKHLVLDVREPHVVKYDTSKTERQKLDMHTDKSTWTFLIALSEGRGEDYTGGGTYFQDLNCTVHLQRSQMLIFRGKRRHCGMSIRSGCRYLLVGFLVPPGKQGKQKSAGSPSKMNASTASAAAVATT